MGITLLGLGPGRIEQLTLEAWRQLEAAEEVYLRTTRHPLIAKLPQQASYHSFDSLYDEADDFESLYQTIADRVVKLGQRPAGVIYAVPGHPMVGEQTTQLILQSAKANGIPVKVIDGLSFIEPSLAALGIDGITGLQIHDATDIARLYHPPINPDVPTLIAQVYSREIASDVKLTLMNQYPDAYPVVLLHGAGTEEAHIEHLPLYEIDRSPRIAHLTTMYIPAMEQTSSFEAFQNVMAHLRSPEGCPWDWEQTHASLRSGLLEETYEVLEAIDQNDMDGIVEELGDLLLHILFQGQIAIDEGEFYLTDVISKVIAKLIRRHPHVWGDVAADDAGQVEVNWDEIKRQENAQKDTPNKSLLDSVPKALPALIQALRIQERAGGVGFDWDHIAPVIDKVHEEIDEVKKAPLEHLADEFGDLLFAVVNWARWSKIDPESALRETNSRFRRRFAYVEAQGRSLQEMSLQEMDALWNEAKRQGL